MGSRASESSVAFHCISRRRASESPVTFHRVHPHRRYPPIQYEYVKKVIDSSHSTTTEFQNGIQPETDYEVLLWSTNNLGSSDTVKLRVKTPKIFKLFVSSETISLNGNQAIVNFSATEDKIRRLYVQYCLELTGDCNSYDYYNINSTEGQITCDNLP